MPINAAGNQGANYSSPLVQIQGTSVVSDFGLTRASEIIPLKKVWEKKIGEKLDGAIAGPSGKLYLLCKDKVISVNNKGETQTTFQSGNPLAAGEGKERVYVVTGDSDGTKMKAFDLSGKLLWEKPTASSIGYDPSTMFSSPVEDKNGNVWTIQTDVETFSYMCDCDGECNVTSQLIRYSPDGSKMDTYTMDGASQEPVVADRKGNVFVNDSQHLKFSPDFQVTKLQHPAQHLFLVNDQPYSTVQNKMYKLDFTKSMPGQEDEILHWGEDKEALSPLVGKEGSVHVLLRYKYGSHKQAFYVKINPEGPANGKVVSRRTLPLSIDRDDIYTRPYMTPGGTIYFFGERKMVDKKMTYPVYALDPGGTIHSAALQAEPVGILAGEGEQALIATKDGSLTALEAKGMRERINDMRSEAEDRRTLEQFKGSVFGGPDSFQAGGVN